MEHVVKLKVSLTCNLAFFRVVMLTLQTHNFYMLKDLNNMPVQDMLVHLHDDMFTHINQILVNGGPANPSNEEGNN